MVVLTENLRRPGFFLVSEAERTRSRSVVTVAAGQNLVAGQVVGYNDDLKLVAYDNDGTDASSTAKAVLFASVDATDGEKLGVVIARDAEVNGEELFFAASEDTGDKEAAYADLAAVGIIVRFEQRRT